VVDLEREQISPVVEWLARQVHRGFLAGLDDADDVGHEAFAQEMVEREGLDLVVDEVVGIQRRILSVGGCGAGPRGRRNGPGNENAAPSGAARAYRARSCGLP
jgi:hypothetical protein